MLDKNYITGIVLIFAILIGFSVYNSPSEAELAKAKKTQDSLDLVALKQQEAKIKLAPVQTASPTTNLNLLSDSAKQQLLTEQFGVFAALSTGQNKSVFIENEFIKVTLHTKGARVADVELKKYKDYKKNPLHLSNPDSSKFSLTFPAQNRIIKTDSLYFTPLLKDLGSKKIIELKAEISPTQYILYKYSLDKETYKLDFSIQLAGLQNIIPFNTNQIELSWMVKALQQEKSKSNEANVTSIFYTFMDGEMDNLSETSDDKQTIQNRIKWVSFKQAYFCSALIYPNGFDKPTDLETIALGDSSKFTKQLSASFTLPYKHNNVETYDLSFYYGPNHHQTLSALGLGLEKQINLGWGIVRWVNQYAVIPIFNFLSRFDLNMGIVILLMTIILKTVLFPLTYKAYLSSAKMKVLKPEMDELNAKYEKEDPLKKQQAVMALYRKAGVNPLGGCIPMLLQLPILLAMFRFFPTSIELRQKAFLWADDLSSYDTILNLPFMIPVYGDHVSLFTILMTVSTIIYTRMNSGQFAGNAQMEQMKWIMYLMPVLFMFTLNSYASGLSYYYFIANMLTFSIQYGMKLAVDEDKIHKKIQENKIKPQNNKKSKWQQKLEDIQKQQAQIAKQKGKK
jgi:YidC/Oxa1 family membrane protein insertase